MQQCEADNNAVYGVQVRGMGGYGVQVRGPRGEHGGHSCIYEVQLHVGYCLYVAPPCGRGGGERFIWSYEVLM